MVPTPVVVAALTPFVLWRLYSRIRRLTTRQRSRTWRHRTSLVFFPLLLASMALASLAAPIALAALAAGVALGIPVGILALKKTLFEKAGDEFFFTPHAPIGLGVAALFICRMGYRAYEFYVQGSFAQHDFVRSPLTLLTFGILSGYYMTYAAGLLRWRKGAAN
jgi:ABC-type nitrate/sulfonate/bicarbonate transport system permease component